MQFSPELDAKLKELEEEFGNQFEATGVTEAVSGLAEFLIMQGKGSIAIAVVMVTVAGKLMSLEVGNKQQSAELFDIITKRVREEIVK